jgi:hypothetical protein
MSIKLDPLFEQVGKLAKSTAAYSGSSPGWCPMDFHRGATRWQRSDLSRGQVQTSVCPLSLSLHWDHRKKSKRESFGG